MKRLLLLLFTIIVICTSCASSEKTEQEPPVTPEDTAITFTDSTGYEITLQDRPQRVAVLFSSYADIWVTAGGRVDITVAESVERGFSDESAVLVDEGSGHSEIDIETLVASQPDLVIGTTDYEGQVDACTFCRQSGIPAALFRVETLDDYIDTLTIFTRLTGEAARAETYGTAVKTSVDQMLSDVRAATPEAKKILFIRAGSSAKSTKAKRAEDHFACAMLAELGCENIADSAPTLLDGLSIEQIILENPDHIFITFMGNEAAARSYIEGIFAEDGWRDLTAVRENRYTMLPKDLFHYKPNSRWAQAYRYLIDCLYPGVLDEE